MTRNKHHFIIGTAGHVDHGKSALIRALTGTETDRLKEEQQRGISIDLGFAPFRLPGGEIAGVVDVPGHERFIHNMLAGVGGMDLVLLVVDVNEGVMPQTREHLDILQLLGIERGIMVLTKCDLAEEDWIDIVEEECRDEVAGSFLENAPCCRVSALSGSGLPQLVATIGEQLKSTPPKDSDGPLRLPVDRHFTVSGFGTVVTGTLVSGSIATGDRVEVLPPGEVVRVREVQVHGQKTEQASAGQRVALNLVGLDRSRIERGAVIGTPGFFEQTTRLDARLTLLPSAPRPLKFRDPVHFYLGTARVVGLVALLDRDQLEPGEDALVQIHLDRPLVAHRRDRFIIRSYSPMTTIGGGVVVDPVPAKHRRFRSVVLAALKELESGEKPFLLQKLADHQVLRLKELEQLAGLGQERLRVQLGELAAQGHAIQLGEQWLTAATMRTWRLRLGEALNAYHSAHPNLPGMSRASAKGLLPTALAPKAFDDLVAQMVAAGELAAAEDLLVRPGFQLRLSAAQAQLVETIEGAYREAGAQAKNKQEMLDRLGLSPAPAEEAFAYLFAQGRLIRLNAESFLDAATYDQTLALLRAHFAAQPTLTLAEFRDRLGSSRKLVQALLEYWDGLKYTLRRGDERVAWKLPEKE
jgi:selenocysteine-specific elongation factor